MTRMLLVGFAGAMLFAVSCSGQPSAPLTTVDGDKVLKSIGRFTPGISFEVVEAEIGRLTLQQASDPNFAVTRTSRSGRILTSPAERLATLHQLRASLTTGQKRHRVGGVSAFTDDSTDAEAALEAREITIVLYGLNPPTPSTPGDFYVTATWSPTSWLPWFEMEKVIFSLDGIATSCTQSSDQHEIADGALIDEPNDLEEGSGTWEDTFTLGSHTHNSVVEATFRVDGEWKWLVVFTRTADDDESDEWTQCDAR